MSKTAAKTDGIFISLVLGHETRGNGGCSGVLSDFPFSEKYFNRSEPSVPSESQKSIIHLNLCCDTDEMAILMEKREVIGAASRLLAEGSAVAFRLENPLRLGLAGSEGATVKIFFARLSIFCKLLIFLIAGRVNGDVTTHRVFIADAPHSRDTFIASFSGDAFKKWERGRIRSQKNNSIFKFAISVLLNKMNVSKLSGKYFIILINYDANTIGS